MKKISGLGLTESRMFEGLWPVRNQKSEHLLYVFMNLNIQ